MLLNVTGSSCAGKSTLIWQAASLLDRDDVIVAASTKSEFRTTLGPTGDRSPTSSGFDVPSISNSRTATCSC